MAKVQVEGMSDYTPPELPKGVYDLEVKDCKPNDSGDSIMIQSEIVDGPPTPDGSEARGTSFVQFETIDMDRLAEHKDGGRYAKQRLYEMGQALGINLGDFDTDDLIGVKFKARLGAQKDKNGVNRLRIAAYLPS